MTPRYVQVWKFCELTGYTDEAVRGKIKRGQWLEGKVWRKAPDGHTFASMMCSAGEYPQWIAAQMGHSDGTMVGRVYGRWMPEANPDAGGKAESMW